MSNSSRHSHGTVAELEQDEPVVLAARPLLGARRLSREKLREISERLSRVRAKLRSKSPPPVASGVAKVDIVELNGHVVRHFRKHEKDTGSTRVQIALLTQRIVLLTEHLQKHRKDNASKRGLQQMASRRKKLLAYLERTDPAAFRQTVVELDLR